MGGKRSGDPPIMPQNWLTAGGTPPDRRPSYICRRAGCSLSFGNLLRRAIGATGAMQFVMFHLATLAVLAVLVVLLVGLTVMLRGKSPNLSQKLMRWRVGLQFVAILLIIVYVLINHA
jgi:hypothetical protein